MTPARILQRFRSEHERGVVGLERGLARKGESASRRGREVKGHVTAARWWEREKGGGGGGRRCRSRDFYGDVRKCCQFRRNSRAIRMSANSCFLSRVIDCNLACLSVSLSLSLPLLYFFFSEKLFLRFSCFSFFAFARCLLPLSFTPRNIFLSPRVPLLAIFPAR